jgi:hypothetical protein
VLGEILAVLKIELFLSAFFGRARGCKAVRPSVLKDSGSELLVHQDASLVLRYSGFQGRSEAVVDHLLGSGDLCRLVYGQRAAPAEELVLERPSMIEGQNVKRSVKANGRHAVSLDFR